MGGGALLIGFSMLQQKPGETRISSAIAPRPARAVPASAPLLVEARAALVFDEIGKLEKGALVSLPLPDGTMVEGRLNYVRIIENGATIAGGRLEGAGHIFQIAREPWGYRGFILRRDEGIAYVYGSGDDGRLTVARRPIGEVICEPDPNWEPVVQTEQPDLQEIPIYNEGRSVGVLAEPIPILHSLPRARATIYLDFDGEVIEGHSWEGGERIVAPAYRFTASRVEEIWREVSEDFAPFEVNVTTDLQAYLRAPQGLRIHCITTSNNFAGAGGVAFNNTFRESGSPVCWNFDQNSGAPIVISHEVGHTFGLHHDGINDQGYYGGHGSWGPIMGAPYGKPVTHWSDGAYVGANQQQDDMAYIGSSVPEREDLSPEDSDGAIPLAIGPEGAVDQEGVIINRHDVDRYSFTTSGGSVTLNFTGGPTDPNLNIEAKLYSPTGALIVTSSPTNSLGAQISSTVGAGIYTVTIDGVADGTWSSNGYDDYGSIGQYRITGTIPTPGWRFGVDPTSVNSALVGQVDPGLGSSFSILSGNTNSAFSIDGTTGEIRVADAAALTPGTTFSLAVRYRRNGSPTQTTVTVEVDRVRGLKYELWTGLGGSGIGGLTGDADYPNQPDFSGRAGTFQAVHPGNNYGQKLSGYLIPDETGEHRFWTTADDASELWLSSNDNPANRTRIAYNHSNTAPDNWTQLGTQASAAVSLVAGQRYYIEFLSRENAGGDHASVVWQTPTRPRQLIPRQRLEFPGTPANRAPWIASRTYRVREDGGVGTPIAVLEAGDFEPGSTLSQFAITGGNVGNAIAIDATTGELRVNGALSFAARPMYYLDVSAEDSGGLSTTARIAMEVVPLAVKREFWSGIGGNAVSDLTSHASFPGSPTAVSYETHFEAPTGIADSYGQRLSGYLRAPDSGNYTFWISSDDHGEIWLSTDTNPANKTRIAYHTGATGFREWERFPTQRSGSITLEGGRFYYIEVLQKEGIGGDHVSVAWEGPNFSRTVLGSPHVTQTFYNHGAPQLADLTATIFTRDTGVTIATLEAKDWANPGTTVRFAITGGNADGAFSIDELTGELRTTAGPLAAGTRVLTVTATDNAPTPLSGTATVTVQIRPPALKREVWTGLPDGQALSDLTDYFTYPALPDVVGYTADFEAPSGWGERYGQRLSGYVIPPASGDYTFWIASDDGGELWLSTDMNPANRRKLCQVNGSVSARNWTAQGNQQSAVIPLVAGQRYYIEALQKEGIGGDHLAVAWQGPGISRRVIEGDHLEYPEVYRPGMRREMWHSGDWNNFPVSTTPDFTGTVIEAKAPNDVRDNYLQRLSGYLVPPATGNYRFWIASDDDSRLLLSTGDDPAGIIQIASQSGYVEPETWTAHSSQRSAFIRLVAGQRYYLEARHRDGIGGDHLAIAWEGPGFSREIIANRYLEVPDAPADRTRLRRERWSNVAGNNIGDLTSDAAFPASPTSVSLLPAQAGLKGPTEDGADYGQRISGYLVAPETGRYTFWIASDDQSAFWLSSDENPANRVRVSWADSVTGERSWDQLASQKSVPIALEAGSRYYFDVMHKEGGGQDYVAVAWEGPGITRQIISNAYLEHLHSLPGTPSLRRETWSGIAGQTIANLTADSAYQSGVPESRGVLTAFEVPRDQKDSYGQRVAALLTAPETGNYRFWIASDETSELWLSPDADRADRMLLAGTPAWTAFRQWDKYPSQASGVLTLVAGRTYYLEALHKEHLQSDHLSVAWEGPSFGRTILDGRFLSYPGSFPAPVVLRREIWTGIEGNFIADLTNSARYPDQPDRVESLDAFEAPVDWGDRYGQRISGYLIAPKSGEYTFWIVSDDAGELWLSTTGNPVDKTRVAWADGATGLTNWENFASQKSATITLTAGQRCYIEGLNKEGIGGDYFSAAWEGPDFSRRIISSDYLEYPGLLPGTHQPGTPATLNPLDPGYAFWLDAEGVTGSFREPGADPDADGVPNALEFVLGGNPLGASTNPAGLLPVFETDATHAVFVFRRADVAAASAPEVEISTLLGEWETAVAGVGQVTIAVENDGFGAGIDRVTVRVPKGSEKLFMRLVTGF